MVQRRPLIIADSGCPEELPVGDTLPFPASALPFFDFIREETGLINQTTVLEDYLILSPSIPDTGNYEIGWYYEWSYDSGGQDMRVEIDIDGTEMGIQRQEPKDTGGGGPTFQNTGGGNTSTGTNQIHNVSGFDVVPLTIGDTPDIRIRFRGSTNNDEAAIHRGRIFIRRVS